MVDRVRQKFISAANDLEETLQRELETLKARRLSLELEIQTVTGEILKREDQAAAVSMAIGDLRDKFGPASETVKPVPALPMPAEPEPTPQPPVQTPVTVEAAVEEAAWRPLPNQVSVSQWVRSQIAEKGTVRNSELIEELMQNGAHSKNSRRREKLRWTIDYAIRAELKRGHIERGERRGEWRVVPQPPVQPDQPTA